MVSRYLERNGMRVIVAYDSLQALEIIEREAVELIISDVRMPYLDGIRLMERVRSNPKHATLPFVLMSNHLTDALTEEGLRKGAAMILPKPLRLDGLLSIVRFAE